MVKDKFFISQELLLGKSMCDLCLSEPKKIRAALETWKDDYDEKF